MKLGGEFHYSKCRNCGLLFINPMPGKEIMDRHYPKDEYYSYSTIDTESFSTKARKLLYDLFFRPGNRNYLLKCILFPMKIFSRSAHIVKNTRLLDIGCGSGQFLHEMKSFGVQTYGVEPGVFPDENSKQNGLDIFCGNLLDAQYPDARFDIVTMNHVLEHVHNPREILCEIRRILKPGGRFIVAVPNTRSLAFRLFGKNWYQLDTPRHLVMYSDHILASMLGQTGFKILSVRFNSGPRQFSFSAANAIGKPWMRKYPIFLDIPGLILAYLVNIFRFGDQFEMICIKE